MPWECHKGIHTHTHTCRTSNCALEALLVPIRRSIPSGKRAARLSQRQLRPRGNSPAGQAPERKPREEARRRSEGGQIATPTLRPKKSCDHVNARSHPGPGAPRARGRTSASHPMESSRDTLCSNHAWLFCETLTDGARCLAVLLEAARSCPKLCNVSGGRWKPSGGLGRPLEALRRSLEALGMSRKTHDNPGGTLGMRWATHGKSCCALWVSYDAFGRS